MQQRVRRLLSFLEQDPDNAVLLADVASLQMALGDFDQACRHAERAVRIDARSRAAHAVLGLIAAQRQDHETAASHLAEAYALGERDLQVQYDYARTLAMLGRFAEAEAPAHEAALARERLPHAPALYIRVLHYLGKLDEAIAFAEALGRDDAMPPRVNGMLSTLYLDIEEPDKARAAASAALAQDPNDSDALTAEGLLALGDLDARLAHSDFERVLRSQPQHGRALLGSGLSQLLAGDIDGAAQTLEQAVATSNMRSHNGTWQALAWCHILRRDIDGAERALQHALELDRNFAETHGGLALVALMRGNLDSAIQGAKRANGLDRGNLAGNFAESLIQQVSGNPAGAQAILQHLLSQPIMPDGKTVQEAVAEMLARSAGI